MTAVLHGAGVNVDRSVTPHRSCYIHGLWFCLFCGNTNSHRSLKLNGQGCSSSGLLFSPNVETTCAYADTTSRLPHCRHGSLPCCCGGGLGSAVGCSQRGSPSVASPLPPGRIHSAGPGGSRTTQAAPKQAHFIGGG